MSGERTYYLAICRSCAPELPVPFDDQAERDIWADEHATATGHAIDRATEIRRWVLEDPGPVPRLEGDNIVKNWRYKGP